MKKNKFFDSFILVKTVFLVMMKIELGKHGKKLEAVRKFTFLAAKDRKAAENSS